MATRSSSVMCERSSSVCTSAGGQCVAEERCLDTLNHYFKYSSFRPGQLDAILAVLNRKDVFVRMATGSGKSLCMFIPVLASHENAMGIIVSPLNGLMDQQVLLKCI